EFGDLFCEVAARESSSAANQAFLAFGEAHRSIDKQMLKVVRSLHPIVRDLNTFVEKAIPDTKLTLKKYLDVKFEYLSFCLKLKEMDDEEMQFASLDEPLYRLETGNYEYRYVRQSLTTTNNHNGFLLFKKTTLTKRVYITHKKSAL
ncbi:PRKCA-binding protein, partial [Toxocara canis]